MELTFDTPRSSFIESKIEMGSWFNSVHFSKIEYSAGGEVRHLTFDDVLFGPDFVPLAQVIKEYALSPVVICESDGTQAEDALTMKNIFYNI